MPAEPLPVIIDTDCGIDDAVALWWALTDPALEVVAVTTVWGNADVADATRNVGRVLLAAGRTDVPVAVGASGPVAAAPELRRADFIHGRDGLGDCGPPDSPIPPVDESAVELLRRLTRERPGELTLLTLGPLTNVAEAITADDSWAGSLRDLVVMGGAAGVHGNALPAGEANVAHDPTAADLTVRARWRTAPLLVGLDVTLVATLTDAHFALLAEHRTPAAAFLDAPLRYYRTFGSTFTPGECPCHDLLAVMAAADPSLLTAPELPLAVQATPGPAWGQTVVDFRGPFFDAASGEGGDATQPSHDGTFRSWRVALDVDVERFRGGVDRLFGGGKPT